MHKSRPDLPAFHPELRSSVEQAAIYLGISRARVWQHVKSGTIKTVRDGRRVFVPNSEIVRLSSVSL